MIKSFGRRDMIHPINKQKCYYNCTYRESLVILKISLFKFDNLSLFFTLLNTYIITYIILNTLITEIVRFYSETALSLYLFLKLSTILN